MARKVKKAVDYMEEAKGLVEEAWELVREHEHLFDDPDSIKLVWDLERVERKVLEAWSTGDKNLARSICYEARRVYRYIKSHIDYYNSLSF